MNYKKRLIEAKLLNLAGQFPVLALTGGRQVGKSTLLAHLYGQKMRRVVFDPVVDVENARQDPELFLTLNQPPIILDEIQYAPELVPVIKRRVDDLPGKNGLFFVTGSQQLAVIKTISESLAGRAAMVDLAGMALAEILETTHEQGALLRILAQPQMPQELTLTSVSSPPLFDLLFRGGYPRTLDLDEGGTVTWFDSYLKTYVERDIRTLGNIDDLQLFTRFVKLCAQMTAREVNHSQLGREIGVDPKTARRWLAMLKASYQWFELPAFSGNVTKRLSQKVKGHFSDVGFAAFLASIFSPAALAAHPLLGQLFETYAVSEIAKRLQTLPATPMMYHWRSFGGAEVDMVIEKDGYFWPIEIKLAARPSPRDTRGLDAFAATYPRLRIPCRLIISGGDAAYKLDRRTWVVPVTRL
jgi:uncharacterized protein